MEGNAGSSQAGKKRSREDDAVLNAVEEIVPDIRTILKHMHTHNMRQFSVLQRELEQVSFYVEQLNDKVAKLTDKLEENTLSVDRSHSLMLDITAGQKRVEKELSFISEKLTDDAANEPSSHGASLLKGFGMRPE